MKNTKVLLSVFMVLVIICVSTAPAFAIVAPEDVVSTTVHWSDKIDELVKEQMDEVSDNEKIPVWVWFTDIDDSNVEAMVEKQTGLTRDKLSVETNVDTEELISALATASVDDSEKALSDVKTEMKTYLDSTKEERELERQRVDTYLQAKTDIQSELHIANNEKIIRELKVDEKDIAFQSILTPSSIMNLTKSEIVEIAKSDRVVSVDYYDDTVEPTGFENEIDVSQADAVQEMLGLTGDKINIILADNNHVKLGITYANEIKDKSKITVVVDKQEYSLEEAAAENFGHNSGHANRSAGIIQSYAKNVHIYSPGGTSYSDIEWLFVSKSGDEAISLITTIITIGYTYNAQAKWFEALVSDYNRALVSGAGNSITQGDNWPHVGSPANSYNSIAVGAYKTNGNPLNDIMNDFRYGPTESEDLPSYKPDCVMSGDFTSYATPGVVGIVAMLLELDQELIAQPEVVKAILMASCHRKVLPIENDVQEEMNNGLTQKQGAGAVDAFKAMQIVLQGTYGEKTITSNNQTATVISLQNPDDVNMSIAWSRENKNTGILQTDLVDLQDLELKIFKNGNQEFSSEKRNAGKQLVYMPNASGTYFAVIYKASEFTEDMTYGYAWSAKNYMKPQIELKGKTAIGHTLTADIKYRNDYSIPEDLISYTWKRSFSGTSWETISGANSKNYTLTDADFLYYIKCNASMTTDTLPLTSLHAITSPIRIVKFGDIDYDMAVTVVDASMINQYVSNEISLSAEQLYAADVDGDGQVTNLDATLIQQYRIGLISSFPVENDG